VTLSSSGVTLFSCAVTLPATPHLRIQARRDAFFEWRDAARDAPSLEFRRGVTLSSSGVTLFLRVLTLFSRGVTLFSCAVTLPVTPHP
jgi:hypothetical protein